MNWDAMGAIGEVVGALAVFGTLIYLALQIRIQNQQLKTQNRESRLAAGQELLKSVREIFDSVRSDPSMVQIVVDSVHRNMEGFDPVSASRLSMLYASTLAMWESGYRQHLEKQLDSNLWLSIEKANYFTLRSPAFKQWWQLRSHTFSDDFVEYLNAIEVPQAVPDVWHVERSS